MQKNKSNIHWKILPNEIWICIFANLPPLSWPNLKLVKKIPNLILQIAEQQKCYLFAMERVPELHFFSLEQNRICQIRAAQYAASLGYFANMPIATFCNRRRQQSTNALVEEVGYKVHQNTIIMHRKKINPQTQVDYTSIVELRNAGDMYFAEQDLQSISWCFMPMNTGFYRIGMNSVTAGATNTQVRARIVNGRNLELSMKQMNNVGILKYVRLLFQLLFLLLCHFVLYHHSMVQLAMIIMLLAFNDRYNASNFAWFVNDMKIYIVPASLIVMWYKLQAGLFMLYLTLAFISKNSNAKINRFIRDVEQHPKMLCTCWIIVHFGEYLYPTLGIIIGTLLYMFWKPAKPRLFWNSKYENQALLMLPY